MSYSQSLDQLLDNKRLEDEEREQEEMEEEDQEPPPEELLGVEEPPGDEDKKEELITADTVATFSILIFRDVGRVGVEDVPLTYRDPELEATRELAFSEQHAKYLRRSKKEGP